MCWGYAVSFNLIGWDYCSNFKITGWVYAVSFRVILSNFKIKGWGHASYPPKPRHGTRFKYIKHVLSDPNLKLLFSQIISRPTSSRRRGVDLADKVTKRVRLKLSESIWVSDLKRGTLKTFCVAFHSEILPPPSGIGPLLLSALGLLPRHLFHRSVWGAQRKPLAPSGGKALPFRWCSLRHFSLGLFKSWCVRWAQEN